MGEPFAIKNIGGADFVDPVGDEKIWLKYYPLPPRDDLAVYIKLLESFERRLFYTADRGYEMIPDRSDIDEYIATRKTEFETKQGPDKELAGSRLCLAYHKRGILSAKEHIRKRMPVGKGGEGLPDDAPQLQSLMEKIASDLHEGGELLQYVSRRRGHSDIDQVVAEMKGEPFNIFMGTTSNGEAKMHHFHRNRYRKELEGIRCIDRVLNIILPVAQSHPELVQAQFPDLLQTLVEQAKWRLQLNRADPEFTDADDKLCATRNSLQHMTKKSTTLKVPALLPADHKASVPPVSANAREYLRNAVDLIYDMAVVRGGRGKSVDDLEERIRELMPELAPEVSSRLAVTARR